MCFLFYRYSAAYSIGSSTFYWFVNCCFTTAFYILPEWASASFISIKALKPLQVRLEVTVWDCKLSLYLFCCVRHVANHQNLVIFMLHQVWPFVKILAKATCNFFVIMLTNFFAFKNLVLCPDADPDYHWNVAPSVSWATCCVSQTYPDNSSQLCL